METTMRRTATRVYLATSLVIAAAWPGVALAAGSSITGTVTFAGTVPAKLATIPMDADPVCAKKHATPVQSEKLVLGSGNTMGNILVWVSKGLPAGKTYPAPSTPVTLDQNGCMYAPHVQGIMVGQTYHILNSDGVLHNIHALPKINSQFNKPMPATMKETSTKFDKAEDVFQIKCDVHPWMMAWMGVFSHPFFATTKADGKFTISGLDPGTYTITAWHEVLGTQTTTVTVGANETKTANFKFTTPGAK
jgi:plastocyanin